MIKINQKTIEIIIKTKEAHLKTTIPSEIFLRHHTRDKMDEGKFDGIFLSIAQQMTGGAQEVKLF